MQDKVKGPAIALIILGSLGVALQLFGLVASSAMEGIYRSSGMLNEEQLQMFQGPGRMLMTAVGALLGLAGSGFTIFGGLQMMKLRNWPIALIASILVMIPCFSSCGCLLGIPVGIWSIVVLSQADVKAAFQQSSLPPQ